MSKRQRGNKEPKKPKQVRPPPVPVSASSVLPGAMPERTKRK
jgi:hypothetical protein